MAQVWELERRQKGTAQGRPPADWQGFLFTSKAKALQMSAVWLREGWTISGPRARPVH